MVQYVYNSVTGKPPVYTHFGRTLSEAGDSLCPEM